MYKLLYHGKRVWLKNVSKFLWELSTLV